LPVALSVSDATGGDYPDNRQVHNIRQAHNVRLLIDKSAQSAHIPDWENTGKGKCDAERYLYSAGQAWPSAYQPPSPCDHFMPLVAHNCQGQTHVRLIGLTAGHDLA